jgi:hypothetical protein
MNRAVDGNEMIANRREQANDPCALYLKSARMKGSETQSAAGWRRRNPAKPVL